MSAASSPTGGIVDAVQRRRYLQSGFHSFSAFSIFIGNYSANADPGYFSPHHHHELGLEQTMAPGFAPSPTPQQYITPGSPCDETLVGYTSCPSPYSSPYNSPQSINCNTPVQLPISPPQPLDLLSNHMVPDPTFYPDTSLAASIAASMNMPLYNEGITTISKSANQLFYSNVSQWNNPQMTFSDSFLEAPASMIPGAQNQLIDGEVPIKVFQQDTPIDFYNCPPTPDSTENGHVYCPDIVINGYPTMCSHFQGPPKANCTNRVQPKNKRPKHQKPAVQVDDSGIKDIPTSAQLWEFTLRVLKKPMYHYMINWDNQKEGLFRFHDAQAFAALWGKHRNRPNMTYDKVARALRYYYKRDILNQVGGRLTYKFSKRLGKLYLSESK